MNSEWFEILVRLYVGIWLFYFLFATIMRVYFVATGVGLNRKEWIRDHPITVLLTGWLWPVFALMALYYAISAYIKAVAITARESWNDKSESDTGR